MDLPAPLMGWLGMGAGMLVLIVLVAVLVGVLTAAVFLWLAGRLVEAEGTTFRKALVATCLSAVLTIVVLALAGIAAYYGAGLGRFRWVPIAMGLMVCPVIHLLLIRRGFEIPFAKALGVWAAATGLEKLVQSAAVVIGGMIFLGSLFSVTPWTTQRKSDVSSSPHVSAQAPAARPQAAATVKRDNPAVAKGKPAASPPSRRTAAAALSQRAARGPSDRRPAAVASTSRPSRTKAQDTRKAT